MLSKMRKRGRKKKKKIKMKINIKTNKKIKNNKKLKILKAREIEIKKLIMTILMNMKIISYRREY